jgi:LPS O-antigen subunit length determinant protein (WzzB/FepE family)
MTKLTQQFNQERVELESHYKKQIEELSQQFELRKKEMDTTIVKERTELKERLELEYQAMLKSQKAADEQR